MWLNFNLGMMINNHILYPLLILNLNIEFLKKKNPPNKSCFDILLVE